MKIGLISDVHLEFVQDICNIEIPECDYLMLAGDIFVASTWRPPTVKRASEFFERCSESAGNVIMVLGNHEHYGGEMFNTFANCQHVIDSLGLSNFTLLEDTVFTDDRITVFGTTLWTDFYNDDPMAKLACERNIKDFYYIEYAGERLSSDMLVRYNKTIREKLKVFVDTETDLRKMVITHHAPSIQSVHARFLSNINTATFANSGLEEMIIDSDVSHWFHGHNHDACDYELGNTRILCNPKGYPGQNSGWRAKIIEI